MLAGKTVERHGALRIGDSDDELAAVANFVNGFFDNGTTKVTAADIDKARKSLP